MPHAEPGFDVITEREKGLHRGLSTGQLSMIAIGGAIGTGLFLGSGFAISFAAPASLSATPSARSYPCCSWVVSPK